MKPYATAAAVLLAEDPEFSVDSEEDPLEYADGPNDNTRAGAVEEEEGQDLPGRAADANNTGGAQEFKEEAEVDEYKFDSFPDTPVFQASLSRILDGSGTNPDASRLATNTLVQPSAPGKQSSRANPDVAVEEVGRGIPMEGVEATQSTCGEDAGISDGQDEEDVDMHQ